MLSCLLLAPTGLCNLAQGCEARATLGFWTKPISTLKELRPLQHHSTACAELCVLIEVSLRKTQPIQGWGNKGRLPRVARCAQPWAKLQSPVGAKLPPDNQIPPPLFFKSGRVIQSIRRALGTPTSTSALSAQRSRRGRQRSHGGLSEI